MLKKGFTFIIAVGLLLPFLPTAALSPVSANPSSCCPTDYGPNASLHESCDMDSCGNSQQPKCPLCQTSTTVNPYLHLGGGILLPPDFSSFIVLRLDTLSDQGVTRSVFRPPALLL